MARIKVELEFIPVEERLPVCRGTYLTMSVHGGEAREVYWSGRDWFRESEYERGAYNVGKTVTHWAEIPEVHDGEK